MLRVLTPDERRVLLVHERSHLRHRHHCYLAVAAITQAAVPFLSPLSRRLRLSIERWADEDTASEIGDRPLVARAILHAALAQQDQPRAGLLTLGGLGVGARVEALLDPSPRTPGVDNAAVAAGAAALALGLLSSTLQVHHLYAFAVHVCGL